jgi:putative flippase GtrA
MTRDRLASFAELARFGAVGVGTTLLYGALGLAFINAGWNGGVASIAAYLISAACSYVGHRRYTFGVTGGAQRVARFLVVNAVGLAVAMALPPAFAALGGDPRWGVVTACIAIPLSNYFALKRLVFAEPAAARALA